MDAVRHEFEDISNAVISEISVPCYALALFAKMPASFQYMQGFIKVLQSANTLWEQFARATK